MTTARSTPLRAVADPAPRGGTRIGTTTVLGILAVALALGLLRLATLGLALADGTSPPGLHVDEAQYWQWSRALDWGYYSKPPVIAVLLAGATAVFGDGVLAVKSVALILYPLTAVVLGLLAARLVVDDGGPGRERLQSQARRAGLLAATLFMASPLAALLGLATTTDAPLLLCWSAASLLLWQARRAARAGRPAIATWLALGLVCGIGLLSKYSYAAWLLGAGAWIVLDRGGPGWTGRVVGSAHPAADRDLRRIERRGLAAAAGVTVALLLPHLAWNAAMGWPTLQHTAEITAVPHGGAADGPLWRAVLEALLRGLSVPAGAMLMAGPLLVLPILVAVRTRDRRPAAPIASIAPIAASPSALRFVLMLHLPLLLLGMAQALRGEPQINWVAPLVPGIVLLLACGPGRGHGAQRPLPRGLTAGVIGLSAAHLLIGAVLPLAHTLSQGWRATVDPQAATLPRRLDIWARMRGWPDAYATLRPALTQALADEPDLPLLTVSRSVIAIGMHAWRDLPLDWRAWTGGGPPRTHQQMVAGWSPDPARVRAALTARPVTVLVLVDAEGPLALPAALQAQFESPERLGSGMGRAADHSRVTLTLWRARLRASALPDRLAAGAGRPPDQVAP